MSRNNALIHLALLSLVIASAYISIISFDEDNRLLLVMTGSMDGEPMPYNISSIPEKSLVVMRYLDENEKDSIKIGDVLGYNYQGKIIVHRVIEIDSEHNVLTMKGDVNHSVEHISSKRVVGIITNVYPTMGEIIYHLQIKWTFITIELMCAYVMCITTREMLKIIHEGE